jgi:hypothetical protein
MRRSLGILAGVLLVLCSGCGDSHESLAGQSVSTMKEMESVLATVKDEASAKAAKPKLKAVVDRMNDINARQAKLAAPTEAEIKAIEAKYGKEMEQLQEKIGGHMLRIAFDPKIQVELGDIDAKMK